MELYIVFSFLQHNNGVIQEKKNKSSWREQVCFSSAAYFYVFINYSFLIIHANGKNKHPKYSKNILKFMLYKIIMIMIIIIGYSII